MLNVSTNNKKDQNKQNMAKAKKVEADVSLVSENPDVKKPRLTKLIIKNYRCIGSVPVEIDLNDIVVLVGSNNVGKSSTAPE
jgi:putative ATP-dependent endonuclease of OLD family